MKNCAALLAVISFLMLGVGCNATKKRQVPAFSRAAAVDRAISEIISNPEVPGISLAVFNDEEILFEKYAGIKNAVTGERVDSLTTFEAASLSKTVFAYVVLHYIENGALAFDTPVSSIWLSPDLKTDARHEQLNPLNLLSHTAGLPNWRGAPNLQATTNAALFHPEDSLRINFEPGTKFNYSGEAYLYLQQVLEEVSSKSLQAMALEEVFEPLQMDRSSFVFDASIRSNYATGHKEQGEVAEKYKPRIPLAAASLHTTAGDYARFLLKLTREVKRDGVVSSMVEKLTEVEKGKDYQILWGPGAGIMEFQGKRFLLHWGDNNVFKSYYLYCLDENIGFVYFANGSEGLSIRNKLSKSIFGYEIPMWPKDYVK